MSILVDGRLPQRQGGHHIPKYSKNNFDNVGVQDVSRVIFEPKKSTQGPTLNTLQSTYHSIVTKSTLGTLKISEVKAFQSQLSNARQSAKKDPQFKIMAEGANVLLTSLSPPKTKKVAASSFGHQEERYNIRFTEGDGMCALHALLGTEQNGTYIWNDKPRATYTEALKNALNQKNRPVQHHFVKAMTDALNESLKPNGDRYSKILFDGSLVKDEWVQIKQFEEMERSTCNQLEGAAWKALVKKNKNLQKMIPNYSSKMTPQQLLQAIHEKTDHFIAALSSEDTKQIQTIRQQREELITNFNNTAESFILSQEFVNHYCGKVHDPSFILDTQEIGIAAQLFNKKACVFTKFDGKVHLTESFNSRLEGEPVMIFYSPGHFSRCSKAGAPIQQNRPALQTLPKQVSQIASPQTQPKTTQNDISYASLLFAFFGYLYNIILWPFMACMPATDHS